MPVRCVFVHIFNRLGAGRAVVRACAAVATERCRHLPRRPSRGGAVRGFAPPSTLAERSWRTSEEPSRILLDPETAREPQSGHHDSAPTQFALGAGAPRPPDRPLPSPGASRARGSSPPQRQRAAVKRRHSGWPVSAQPAPLGQSRWKRQGGNRPRPRQSNTCSTVPPSPAVGSHRSRVSSARDIHRLASHLDECMTNRGAVIFRYGNGF